jgi:hypothetical protein
LNLLPQALRVAVTLYDAGKLFDESGGFFVVKIKVHTPDIGWRFVGCEAPRRLAGGRLSGT